MEQWHSCIATCPGSSGSPQTNHKSHHNQATGEAVASFPTLCPSYTVASGLMYPSFFFRTPNLKSALLAPSPSPLSVSSSPATWPLCKASAAPSLQGMKEKRKSTSCPECFLLLLLPVRRSHPLNCLASWPLTLGTNFGWKSDKPLGLQLNSLLPCTTGDAGRKEPQRQKRKVLYRCVLFTTSHQGCQRPNCRLSSHQSGKKGRKKATVKQLLTRKGTLSCAALQGIFWGTDRILQGQPQVISEK